MAAVVLRPGAEVEEKEVQDWVATHLRSSRVPAEVRFLPDLPRSDVGKVLRRVLRHQLTHSPHHSRSTP